MLPILEANTCNYRYDIRDINVLKSLLSKEISFSYVNFVHSICVERAGRIVSGFPVFFMWLCLQKLGPGEKNVIF